MKNQTLYPLAACMLLALSFPTLEASEHSDECYREGVLDRKCLSTIQKNSLVAVEDAYRRISARLKESLRHVPTDSTDPETRAEREWEQRRLDYLAQSQELWRGYRDSVCEGRALEFQGGSLAWPRRMHCLVEMNLMRLRHLKENYEEDG